MGTQGEAEAEAAPELMCPMLHVTTHAACLIPRESGFWTH